MRPVFSARTSVQRGAADPLTRHQLTPKRLYTGILDHNKPQERATYLTEASQSDFRSIYFQFLLYNVFMINQCHVWEARPLSGSV